MMIPIHRNQSWQVMVRCLLILALLLGQSVALAHDHDADKDNGSTCALCLFVQQSGHGMASAIPDLPAQIAHNIPSPMVTQVALAPVAVPYHSRAPPIITC